MGLKELNVPQRRHLISIVLDMASCAARNRRAAQEPQRIFVISKSSRLSHRNPALQGTGATVVSCCCRTGLSCQTSSPSSGRLRGAPVARLNAGRNCYCGIPSPISARRPALLVDKIEKSHAPDTVRAKLIKEIKALPAEALKKVSLSAMEAGLKSVPDIVQWIGTQLNL